MYRILLVLFGVLLLKYCAKQTQLPEGEIPVTTSSNQALQLFLEGRVLFEDLKAPQAADKFDEALKLDPKFAKAYLYRAMSGGGYKVYRGNLDKAVEHAGKSSEGERYEIWYSKATADGDGTKRKEYLDKLLELYPEDKRVHDLAGNYHYNVTQNYEKALSINPNMPSAVAALKDLKSTQ